MQGQAFTATILDTPPVGTIWRLVHLTLECVLYNAADGTGPTGSIPARLYIAGRFIDGSNDGESDSWEGSQIVHPSELISVTWQPRSVTGILQGRVKAEVMQS